MTHAVVSSSASDPSDKCVGEIYVQYDCLAFKSYI